MSNSQPQANAIDDDEREDNEPTETVSGGTSSSFRPDLSPGISTQSTSNPTTNTASAAEGENDDPDSDTDETRVRRGCVIIGPSQAGKTTLLAAIHRACQMPADDNIDLDFAATDSETANLIKLGLANIVDIKKGYDATKVVKRYPFHIGVAEKSRSSWSMPSFTDLDIEMTDGGGGFIFAPVETNEEFRSQMIGLIKRAAVLVLCIDVNSANNLSALHQEMEVLLANTRVKTNDEIKNPLLARLLQRLRTGQDVPKHTIRPKMRLNVDRVLILLTKVDRLTKDFPNLNPLRVAQQIEPVTLARQTLHPELLRSILKSLKPEAQLAVGVCSSYGFMPKSGEPFADPTGKPDVYPHETGELMLRYWTPFGVREAIYFLATGKTSGTVKRITENDLLDDKRVIELKINKQE